mmetsp:Transcript_24461/g.61516  ORF Transcript_24461/g.61516 Transcript_24461/m.61516 type:complete len:133 (+) Transcript_24461:267-665(+)
MMHVSWRCYSHELAPKLELLPVQQGPKRKGDTLYVRCVEDAFMLLQQGAEWEAGMGTLSATPATAASSATGSDAEAPAPLLDETGSQNCRRRSPVLLENIGYPPEGILVEMAKAWVSSEHKNAIAAAKNHVH